MTERDAEEISVEDSRAQIRDRLDRLFFDQEIETLYQEFPDIKDSWQTLTPKTLSKYPGLAGHVLQSVTSLVRDNYFGIIFMVWSPASLSPNPNLLQGIYIMVDKNDYSSKLRTEILERANCRITRMNDNNDSVEEIKRNEIICELVDLVLMDQERLKSQD